MKRKRKYKTKLDRIYTYTCRFAVFAGIVMIFFLGMAIDTTDISEADLTLWGVSSLVLMVLGAIGMRAEE